MNKISRKLVVFIVITIVVFSTSGFTTKCEPVDEVIIEDLPQEPLVEDEVIVEEEPVSEEVCVGLLRKSNLTVEQLEGALYYQLADYAEVFIEAEKETGVNAIFLASVAALESGWGRSKVAKNKNNLYGWTTDTGDYKVFESKEECIKFIAHKFKELYLSPEGRYFTGYEVENINYYYNGRQAWADAVNNIMGGITRRALKVNKNQDREKFNTTK